MHNLYSVIIDFGAVASFQAATPEQRKVCLK